MCKIISGDNFIFITDFFFFFSSLSLKPSPISAQAGSHYFYGFTLFFAFFIAYPIINLPLKFGIQPYFLPNYRRNKKKVNSIRSGLNRVKIRSSSFMQLSKLKFNWKKCNTKWLLNYYVSHFALIWADLSSRGLDSSYSMFKNKIQLKKSSPSF